MISAQSSASDSAESIPTVDSEPPKRRSRLAREAAAVLLIATALYSALALWSFEAHPLRSDVVGEDWVGPVGAGFARALVQQFGVASWLFPAELTLLALPLLSGRESQVRFARFAGDAVVAVVLSALAHVAFPGARAFGEMPFGGQVGELFGEVMRALFSTVGSYIIGLTVVSLILVGRASFSVISTAQRVGQVLLRASERAGAGAQSLAHAWATARELDKKKKEEDRAAAEPTICAEEADAIIAALVDTEEEPSPLAPPSSGLPDAPAADAEPSVATALRVALDEVPTPSPIMPVTTAPSAKKRSSPEPEPEATSPTEEPVEAPLEAPTRKRARKPRQPKIVDTSDAQRTEKADRIVPAVGDGFRLPTPDMLELPEGGPSVVDEERLKSTAALLEKTLIDYGVKGKVEEIHPGPTVTTFEVAPAAGTKVSKVAGLVDDLALGLSCKVRIIAPIPGKNRIGFEIPNDRRRPVNLRELIEDRRFMEMKAPLPCVLGRDIVGAPYFADLASMPHMIVAGATGAGKSVGLNVVLVSLLMRMGPDQLRLLMVDPKVVELAPFDRIPHMLLPVVTDMKQASNALRWAVDEMERRYQLFANAGTRNVTSYNHYVERVHAGEIPPPKPPATVAAVAPDGTEVEVAAAKDGSDADLPEKLPFIVIVIDEFADLMMQQGKDVEASVARLAQKARAAGMHVILATQRPSVDVITGMIKANFPTRVAFRVAQKVDSRTILDEQGAEHLLGKGDMLVRMNGTNETRRVQCPFCSEEEIQRVCDFLRLQGEPVYDESILKPRDDDAEKADASDAEQDPLYDQAVRIVAETRRCSTSWIQRKLGIGYNRAAKMVETMERRGLVGPANGAKDREILIEAH